MALKFVESKGWKNFMAKLYGWGAAVVILGALFKIMHFPGAGPMLVVGLGTEAIIFFFSAFEPPHPEYDWSLVYPELAGVSDEHFEEKEDKRSITEQLDDMLEEAKIAPELIESLGIGMRKLSENASKLSDISEASTATNEYVSNVKVASSSVSELSNVYTSAAKTLSDTTSKTAEGLTNAFAKTSEAIHSSANNITDAYSNAAQKIVESAAQNTGGLSDMFNRTSESISQSASQLAASYNKAASSVEQIALLNQDSQEFGEKIRDVSKNLSALNAIYDLQLQSSKEHMQKSKELYDGVNTVLQHLNDSVDDTRKYRENISELSKNLSTLNTVYGNMLTAMNINVAQHA